jgi:hypothetical protein
VPAPKKCRTSQIRSTKGRKFLTVKSFLGTRADRAKHSMDDIDYCSNNNSTPCHLTKDHRADLEFSAWAVIIFCATTRFTTKCRPARIKSTVIVEGASHGIRPCRDCETTPGQYGNSVKNTFDHMQKWINARFN